jgi:BirA family biotin operon repressor/biotin-[acetyl-CoA-carboxylase] ligase
VRLRSLDATAIRRGIAADPLLGELHVLGVVDSTNDVLRRLAASGAAEGTVVLAEQQTAGRGRLGRSWFSPAGLGLYVSLLLRPTEPPGEATRWTVAAAVAAARACRSVASCPVCIAWPNDLVLGSRKLGGILAELRVARRSQELLIGTGINVLHAVDELPPELRARATSLRIETRRDDLEREALATAYLSELSALTRQLRDGGWPALARCFESLAPEAFGVPVRVHPRPRAPAGEAQPALEGVTCGLDSRGALQVRLAEGGILAVRIADSISRIGAAESPEPPAAGSRADGG